MFKYLALFVLSFLLNSSAFCQDLKIKLVKNKNYEIKIPKDWEDLDISFGGVSLSVIKPKTKDEPNPAEAIGMKHVKTNKNTFQDAYEEYLGLLKGYYKEGFKIIEESTVLINDRKFVKLIVNTKSKINGKNRKNIMYYTFINNESHMMTLISTKENFDNFKSLYDKISSSLKFHQDKNYASNPFIEDLKLIDNSNLNLEKLKAKYPNCLIYTRDIDLDNKTSTLIERIKKMNVGEIFKKSQKSLIKLLTKEKRKVAKISAIYLPNSTEKEVNDIIKQYKKSGDFAKLASKYSQDKFYAKKGGDAGWVYDGYLTTQINNSVFKHKKGDIFKINENQLGWFIILKTGNNKLSEFAKTITFTQT
jgi:predicted CopG family antitoxin